MHSAYSETEHTGTQFWGHTKLPTRDLGPQTKEIPACQNTRLQKQKLKAKSRVTRSLSFDGINKCFPDKDGVIVLHQNRHTLLLLSLLLLLLLLLYKRLTTYLSKESSIIADHVRTTSSLFTDRKFTKDWLPIFLIHWTRNSLQKFDAKNCYNLVTEFQT